MIEQLKQAWERLRSFKGFTTWLWVVILFVILAIGFMINDPLPAATGESGSGVFGSTGLALSVFFRWIALIGFIYLAFIFFKKWQSKKSGPAHRKISVSERFYISPKQTLLLVKLNNREFLVGATDSSIQLLAEMESEEDETDLSGSVTPPEFESLLTAKKAGQSSADHE